MVKNSVKMVKKTCENCEEKQKNGEGYYEDGGENM